MPIDQDWIQKNINEPLKAAGIELYVDLVPATEEYEYGGSAWPDYNYIQIYDKPYGADREDAIMQVLRHELQHGISPLSSRSRDTSISNTMQSAKQEGGPLWEPSYVYPSAYYAGDVSPYDVTEDMDKTMRESKTLSATNAIDKMVNLMVGNAMASGKDPNQEQWSNVTIPILESFREAYIDNPRAFSEPTLSPLDESMSYSTTVGSNPRDYRKWGLTMRDKGVPWQVIESLRPYDTVNDPYPAAERKAMELLTSLFGTGQQ